MFPLPVCVGVMCAFAGRDPLCIAALCVHSERSRDTPPKEDPAVERTDATDVVLFELYDKKRQSSLHPVTHSH